MSTLLNFTKDEFVALALQRIGQEEVDSINAMPNNSLERVRTVLQAIWRGELNPYARGLDVSIWARKKDLLSYHSIVALINMDVFAILELAYELFLNTRTVQDVPIFLNSRFRPDKQNEF